MESFPLLSPPPRVALASQPTDIELTNLLRAHVHSSSGSAMPVAGNSSFAIHKADVYAIDPAELTGQFTPAVAEDGGKAWYFFTKLLPKTPHGKRMNRCVDSGVWHDEGKSKPVVSIDGGKMGQRKLFSFKKKGPDGKQSKIGWLMSEYRLHVSNLVLCKIYAPTKQVSKKYAPTKPSRPRMASTDNEVPQGPVMVQTEVGEVMVPPEPVVHQCPTGSGWPYYRIHPASMPPESSNPPVFQPPTDTWLYNYIQQHTRCWHIQPASMPPESSYQLNFPEAMMEVPPPRPPPEEVLPVMQAPPVQHSTSAWSYSQPNTHYYPIQQFMLPESLYPQTSDNLQSEIPSWWDVFSSTL